MYRSTFVKSTSGTLLLLTVIYAVSAACSGEATAPCAAQISQREQRGLLDFTWRASTINGQTAMGWPLPLPSFDYFHSGIIDFQTTSTQSDGGDCDKLVNSSGIAVANYALRRADGSLTGNKRFVGRFVYDHDRQQLTMTAAGYTVNGTVNGRTMTLPAAHALFGTATVVLTRD